MSIVLRPHHLLCTQGYSGHGYSEAFVEHMNDVVHQLREVPGTKIQLTFSTDTLCSCCPNKLGTDLCDTQEKVKRYDRKTVEYFGLEEKEYDYQALIREIDAKATPEMLADICRDCCWFPISACCKNICEGKYVKYIFPYTRGRRAGDDPARRPVCFILFLRPAPLHRPRRDTGGPGILLAQPAELLAHIGRALTVEEGDSPILTCRCTM